ncbi:unnamed protein product [Schistosoma curassoni]|uniref:Uncharacterized protein n=1 Tax=Schistosoma curassoni TaxID=6186 RepID=A0A183JUQ0_9TREM|nr:unnamed protein product [Schistosoma curassoni]
MGLKLLVKCFYEFLLRYQQYLVKLMLAVQDLLNLLELIFDDFHF